ncbi:MAG: hypothetical protein V1722_02095 [Candidatus Micrarchaeota archaeon]
MEEIFAVRKVDDKTKRFIQRYASDHDLNTGEALREIVFIAETHLRENKEKKKYNSIFDTWDKIKFKGPGNASDRIDEILYDEDN